MASKFYAIRKGRKTGIFTSWPECQTHIKGYPNAIYKSFTNRAEAEEYLAGGTSNANQSQEAAELQAYIDGSYDNRIKRYSFGVIIFYKGEKITYSKGGDDKALVDLRNVAGELQASMYVMNYALERNIKSIEIYFDYNGIEMWATGAWKANLPFTQHYAAYAKEVMKSVNIRFMKVKSHTGNKYNEEVDQLAKDALHVSGEQQESVQDKRVRDDIVLAEENTESVSIDKMDSLKSTKSGLALDGFMVGGKLILQKEVYECFKQKWKSEKRTLSEIKEMKSYCDISGGNFVVQVVTEKDEKIIVIPVKEFC